ncbi:MAG: ATP-binding cassette domain-containing protein, partial [Pseudomonadales bacterium]|nr:ATP-binding cassette domain-containing protein [Pseudomonadales bacterium]
MLSITNLKKTFIQPDGSPLPILDIPHFTVAAGEQVVLVGRSGGGKTTLLHNIAGITNIDSGEITFDSLPIQTLSQEMRDRFRAE